MTESESNDVKIAVIKTQLDGLREQQKAHARETKESIEKLSGDVGALVAVMNKGKGAFGFAMVLAGSLGAGSVALVQFLLKGHIGN